MAPSELGFWALLHSGAQLRTGLRQLRPRPGPPRPPSPLAPGCPRYVCIGRGLRRWSWACGTALGGQLMHSQVLLAHLVGRCLKARHPNSSSSPFLFSASSPACTTTGSSWHGRCRTGKRTKGAFVTLSPPKLQPHFLVEEMAAQTCGPSAPAT